MTYDPFATSTGLLDHYTGTVVESWFGINAQYNPDVHVAMWKIKLDNPEENPQIEDGVIQEQFSIGPTWESLDGGETVEFSGNPNKNFAANSQYGTVIRRAVDEWGLRPLLAERGDPREAHIWLGLRFEFAAQTLGNRFKGRDGEWVEPRPKVMPVQYLGTADDATPKAAVDPASIVNLPTDQLAELRGIALLADSNGQFLDQAMKLTWVAEDGKLIAALADTRLWQALKNS